MYSVNEWSGLNKLNCSRGRMDENNVILLADYMCLFQKGISVTDIGIRTW